MHRSSLFLLATVGFSGLCSTLDAQSVCSQLRGQPCPTDFNQQFRGQFLEHGPGPCENTGTEPGPSLESFDVGLPPRVAPGAEVTFTIDWNRCSDCNPNAVIYSTIVGDWDIDNPLQVRGGYFTNCDQTARDSVTFTAPTQPGTYRIRWIMCFAFDAVRNFCGEGPPGPVSDPRACPYVEASFEVCEFIEPGPGTILADAVADFKPGTSPGDQSNNPHADTFGTGTWTYASSNTSNPTNANLIKMSWDTSGLPGGLYDMGLEGINTYPLIYKSALEPEILLHPDFSEFAVLRWTVGNNEGGTVLISGNFHRGRGEAPPGSGDGVETFIYVDGTLVFHELLPLNAPIGVDYNIVADVSVGSTVDWVVGPNGPGAGPLRDRDTTGVTATVTAISGQSCCPEGQSGGWQTLAPMPTPRHEIAAAEVGGIIYVFGDFNYSANNHIVEAYDPVSDIWESRASMLTNRGQAAAAAVDGVVYVIGGNRCFSNCWLTTNEAYDPRINLWTSRAPMPTRRGLLTATAVGGKIYVMGGGDSYRQPSTHDVVEIYDPATDSWSQGRPMPRSRQHHAAVELGGKIYVIGGWTETPSYSFLASVDVYDPVSNEWNRAAPLSVARSDLMAAVAGGKIYAIGGTTSFLPGDPDPTCAFSIVEEYDSVLDRWRRVGADLCVARSYGAGLGLNGRVYAFGGRGQCPEEPRDALSDTEVLTVPGDCLPSNPLERTLECLSQIDALSLCVGSLIETFAESVPCLGLAFSGVGLLNDTCQIPELIRDGKDISATINTILTATSISNATAGCACTIASAGTCIAVTGAISIVTSTAGCVNSLIQSFGSTYCPNIDAYLCFWDHAKGVLAEVNERILSVFVGSPVTLTVMDDKGRTITLLDTDIPAMELIPDSWVWQLEGNQQLAIIRRPLGFYKVVIEGTAEAGSGSSFDFSILNQKENASYDTVIFEDIPTRSGAISEIVLEETTTEYVLAIDLDGDQIFETSRRPTFINDEPTANQLPICNPNGPYAVECQGPVTTVPLDGTGSSDPDGDPLTYEWTTDCPAATFGDPTSPTPTLTIDTSGCSVECSVTLTVSDGRATDTCSTTVTVQDTTPSEISCSLTSTIEGDDDEEMQINITASDTCGSASVSAVIDIGCDQVPVTDGQIIELECEDDDDCEAELDDGILEIESNSAVLIATATDECGNTSTCSVDLCPSEENSGNGDAGGAQVPGNTFLRGDSNSDGEVDLFDAIFSLSHLFLAGTSPQCLDAADANDDGKVGGNVDAIYLLRFNLLGGPPPPAPYPELGTDPTPDELECGPGWRRLVVRLAGG